MRKCGNKKSTCIRPNWALKHTLNSGVSPLPPYIPTPIVDVDENIMFRIEPHLSKTMMTQSWIGSNIPINTSLEGDFVGTIYDTGRRALVCATKEGGVFPSLRVESGTGLIEFAGASGRPITLPNNKKYFKFLHAVDPLWSMQFKIKMPSGTDGDTVNILSTNGFGNSTTVGILIRRFSNNKIQFYLSHGSGYVAALTHDTIINVASGIVSIQATLNGQGTNKFMVSVNGVEQTSNTNNGVTTDCTADLLIGASASNASDIMIGSLVIWNKILNSAELSNFISYNPSFTEDSFPPVLQWNIDPSNAVMYEDVSETVIATDGDAVRSFISDSPDVDGATRKLTSSSEPSSPVLGGVGGSFYLRYDGVDDNLSFSEDLIKEKGGVYTLIFVAKNEDSLLGSQIISGDKYFVITGKDYPSGQYNRPYSIAHFSSAPESIGGLGEFENNSLEIFVVRRNGRDISWFNGLGVKDTKTGYSSVFTASEMGSPYYEDWDMDGNVYLVQKYIGLLTDDQVLTKIQQLRNRFY